LAKIASFGTLLFSLSLIDLRLITLSKKENVMKYLLLLTSFSLLLAACAVQQNPAHTRVYTPAGVYDYHCPPGQAKKGRC
jgi:hypothetical protein